MLQVKPQVKDMLSKHFKHTASAGGPINVYCWRPDGAPKRVVHIVHGMAEHAGRYAEFAESLTNAGYVVFAQDLRGHGAEAPLPVHFGDSDGWQRLVKDVAEIHTLARDQHPEQHGLVCCAGLRCAIG